MRTNLFMVNDVEVVSTRIIIKLFTYAAQIVLPTDSIKVQRSNETLERF